MNHFINFKQIHKKIHVLCPSFILEALTKLKILFFCNEINSTSQSIFLTPFLLNYSEKLTPTTCFHFRSLRTRQRYILKPSMDSVDSTRRSRSNFSPKMLSPKMQRSIRVNDSQLVMLSERAHFDHSKAGYLHKRTADSNKWQMRWFVLYQVSEKFSPWCNRFTRFENYERSTRCNFHHCWMHLLYLYLLYVYRAQDSGINYH